MPVCITKPLVLQWKYDVCMIFFNESRSKYFLRNYQAYYFVTAQVKTGYQQRTPDKTFRGQASVAQRKSLNPVRTFKLIAFMLIPDNYRITPRVLTGWIWNF